MMTELRVGQMLREADLTVADLARATGLMYKNAWALANGQVQRIELETIAKLCKFFGCQPGELFEYQAEKPTY